MDHFSSYVFFFCLFGLRMSETKGAFDVSKALEKFMKTSSSRFEKNEAVLKFVGSLIFCKLAYLDSRYKEVGTGFPFKSLNEIMEYVANQCGIDKSNVAEFQQSCHELMERKVSFGGDVLNSLVANTKYGNKWKNRSLIVKKNRYEFVFDYIKLKSILNYMECNNECNRYEIIKKVSRPLTKEVLNDFENYLRNPSTYAKNAELTVDNIFNVLYEIGVDTCDEEVKNYLLNYTPSLFCYGTKILENHDYDDKLREWLGIDHKWKLLYRASEHDYTAKSFDKYCEKVIGPILVIIKSSEGWIFGGYAYEAWQYNCIYILLALVLNRSRT